MVQFDSKMEAEGFQRAVADISLVKKKPTNCYKSGDSCMTVMTSSVVATQSFCFIVDCVCQAFHMHEDKSRRGNSIILQFCSTFAISSASL